MVYRFKGMGTKAWLERHAWSERHGNQGMVRKAREPRHGQKGKGTKASSVHGIECCIVKREQMDRSYLITGLDCWTAC